MIILRFLPAAWCQIIQLANILGFVTAIRQHILVTAVIPLYVQLGDLCARTWFDVTNLLVAVMLFGTFFINRYIRAVFLREGRVFPCHSGSIPILSVGAETLPGRLYCTLKRCNPPGKTKLDERHQTRTLTPSCL